VAHAKILDATNYYELKSHLSQIEKGSWVLFDVDFTLIEPVEQELKMPSVMKYANAYIDFYKDMPPEKVDQTLAKMMLSRKTELVDPNFPDLIQILDNQNYVFGFTGMLTGPSFVPGKIYTDLRQEDLAKKGIQFKGKPGIPTAYYFNKMPKYNGGQPALKNNILYSNGEKGPYNKTVALERFLELIPSPPKIIVVIEDRLKNLKAFEEMIEEKYGDKIQFIGIHYTQSWHSASPCLTEEQYLKKLHELLV